MGIKRSALNLDLLSKIRSDSAVLPEPYEVSSTAVLTIIRIVATKKLLTNFKFGILTRETHFSNKLG